MTTGSSVAVVMASIRAPSAKLKKQDSNPFFTLTYLAPALAPKYET
jgi:hypothetical protein